MEYIIIIILLFLVVIEVNGKRKLEKENKELKQKNNEIQIKLEEKENLAYYDALTGIPNRRSLEETVHRVWNRAKMAQIDVAVIMIDIDFFGAYNNYYGHQKGDVCLQRIASILKNTIRPSDFVARYGGEEFTVILVEATKEEAKIVAERLRKAVEDEKILHLVSEDVDVNVVTVSLGVCVGIPGVNFNTYEEMIGEADTALYQAKNAGRNTVIEIIS